MIDNQIERLIRGSLGLLKPVPRLSLPAGLEKEFWLPERSSAHRTVQALTKSMGMARTRSFKRSSQPSLPVPISAARTSSSIAATVSAPTFGNRAAVRNPQHSGANRAQNPDHSAATASASTSAPRRTAWRTSTASACKLTNRARLRALCRWLGAVPQPAAISLWCVQYARTLSATKQFGPSWACLPKRAQRLGKLGRKKAVA